MNNSLDSRLSPFAESHHEWTIPDGVTYLNHGSFGTTPQSVQLFREHLLREHAANPMEFFLRRMYPLLEDACEQLARFVKCSADNLIFTQNSTSAMNIVAENVKLKPDDEVLLTDHEYGAVIRIWGQYCQRAGAKTVIVRLPFPLQSEEELIDSIFEKVTPRTRLLVVSHVASPTSAILPVQRICERARECGLLVCVDGPHAPAMVDIDLNAIPCDYYAASCHKWLCAPIGSGFLYVRSRHKQNLAPNVISWGRNLSGKGPSWKDEFTWPGTFDPTPFLAVPEAIRFMKRVGLKEFRKQMHLMAAYGRTELLKIEGTSPLTTDDQQWYGSMVTVRLPIPEPKENSPNQIHPLQAWLADHAKTESLVVRWQNAVHLRVSCHLYNTYTQIDGFVKNVHEWLQGQGQKN